MIRKAKRIYQIIPKEFQKKSLRYILFSIINVILDLLSIAYFIPLFVFIIDKKQLPSFLKETSFFNEDHLLYWALGFIIVFILKNYVQIIIIKFQSKLVFDIATKLSSSMSKYFLQKDFLQIQHLNKGKEIQKIQMSGTDFSNYILLSINTIFTEAIVIFCIAFISFFFYPTLSFLIIISTIICLYILYIVRKNKIKSISDSIRRTYSTSTSYLLNIIDGFLEIKSLNKEQFFQKKFEKAVSKFNANFVILKTHQNSNIKYFEIFIIIGLSLFLYYVNTFVKTTYDKVLLISFIAGISLRLFPSLNKIILAYTHFKSYKYTIDVFLKLEKRNQLIKNNILFDKSFSLQNVFFSYSEQKPLLKNINFTVKKGEVVGIMGRSGIGKTTLLNIIMGMLKPNSGAVFIDDKKNNYNSSIFSFIGYVPQQPFLFQGSLLDNIIMGELSENIDFTRIDTLINVFELSEFISDLPNGLNSKISHDSLSVSGGQKQRISIVRALYSNPKLLVLDEATNQLDEKLEVKIIKYLKDYAKQNDTTIILVSHSIIIQEILHTTYQISEQTLHKL